MTELQSKLLNMLQWFDAFCRKNDIKYYVIGGTFLGAVRHGGFIPWDDDIDVGLPREDYEKLFSVFNDKTGHYVLEGAESEDIAYCYPYGKLYDTQTTLIENTYRELRRGIYIDLFPLDGIGESKQEAIKNFKKIEKKYNVYLTRICGIREGRKWYKNLAIRAARLVPDFMLNDLKLRKKLNNMAKGLPFETSEYVANVFGNWGTKEIVNRKVFGEPTEYEFEGLTVWGPEKSGDYLTHVYGNWRDLPPENKRVTHHDYLMCDLEKGFID